MIKGFDVSAWQDNNSTPKKIDWEKAKTPEAKFCFIRASYATTIDEDFKYNWAGAKGLLRGAYQFYDYRISSEKQADFFVSLMKDDWGELPPVIDVEQPVQYDKVTMKTTTVPFPPSKAWELAVLSWIDIVEKACGKKPIVYSNFNCIRYGLNLSSTSKLCEYPLWIAAYRNPPTGEPFHSPWKDWTFWQYGTPAVGLSYGMESKELDMDFWNGDEAALLKFAGVQPEPTPELSDKEKLDWLWDKYGIHR